MSYIDKLAWIHIKDRQVLFALSKGSDLYYIPGGKRENGESDYQALVREINEELTVQLLSETLTLAGQFEAQAHRKAQGVTVRMTCYFGGYSGTLQASSEIEELRWLRHKDADKYAAVDAIIMDWLKQKDLID